MYCIVLYCIVLYCIVLYCIVLYYIILYYIILYYVISYAGHLDAALWALEVAEELHLSFHLLESEEVLDTRLSAEELCARRLRADDVSRRHFEDSWTRIWATDALDAAFNGSCFARSPDACADYIPCRRLDRRYPEARDEAGLMRLAPDAPDAMEGVLWAEKLAKAEAWTREQAQLLTQLEGEPDAQSARAGHLRAALVGAAQELDKSLLTDSQRSLLSVASARALSFASKAQARGGRVVALANAATRLLQAASIPDGAAGVCGGDASAWAFEQGTLGALESALQQLDADVVAGINVSELLQTEGFALAADTAELLGVGTSLALQASALAALRALGCGVRTAPGLATFVDLTGIRSAAAGVLHRLSEALPGPARAWDGAPIQKCLSERVRAASEAAAAAVGGGAVVALLPLDFCSRLFRGIAHQVMQVVPHIEAAPPHSGEDFVSASGESRTVHVDASGRLAFVSPYADVVARAPSPGTAGTAFAGEDKVIQLLNIGDGSVNRKGEAPTGMQCSSANLTLADWDPPSCCSTDGSASPGCYLTVAGCRHAEEKHYAEAGSSEQLRCERPDVDEVTYAHAIFKRIRRWPNSSCPFLCLGEDVYHLEGRCEVAPVGYYAEQCGNELEACATRGVQEEALSRLTSVRSSGQGDPRGCELNLTFPLVLLAPPAPLAPPFTVELFVKVRVEDVPDTGAAPTGAVLVGSFPVWYLSLRRSSPSHLEVVFYHASLTLSVSGRRESILKSEAVFLLLLVS